MEADTPFPEAIGFSSLGSMGAVVRDGLAFPLLSIEIDDAVRTDSSNLGRDTIPLTGPPTLESILTLREVSGVIEVLEDARLDEARSGWRETGLGRREGELEERRVAEAEAELEAELDGISAGPDRTVDASGPIADEDALSRAAEGGPKMTERRNRFAFSREPASFLNIFGGLVLGC